MKIKQIWEELENDKSFSKGLLIRRYSGAVLPDVFGNLNKNKSNDVALNLPSEVSLFNNDSSKLDVFVIFKMCLIGEVVVQAVVIVVAVYLSIKSVKSKSNINLLKPGDDIPSLFEPKYN